MPYFICTTCGTQFPESDLPPSACAICQDERQYLKPSGQQWTTHDRLQKSNRNSLRQEEVGLIGIGIEPAFGIGQRALLVQTPAGNILWDCVPLLDEALVQVIRGLGGLSAIAISHPHYYSNVVDWSRAFGDIPIYLHASDAQWVMRSDHNINSWAGETLVLGNGLTLIRCGGHFEGGTVLHWRQGAAGRGVLLSGDIIQVVADRRHVSFMYSYPNFIPLGGSAIERILTAVEPFAYDRIYGAFWDMTIEADAQTAVLRSAERYLAAIREIH
ncbi:MAG: beta-lactamase [Planctomycetaceae bacterium]|nr:beta-lactamase [Planctomycetaceae bacterium]